MAVLRILFVLILLGVSVTAQTKAGNRSAPATLDAGSTSGNMYSNKTLGMTYKVPEQWVLRTEEMNGRGEKSAGEKNENSGARVLLGAFSRPPEAKGEDVNASVLIAVEPVESYPGLTEAAQYFGPLTEVARAQGFMRDEDPYEVAFDKRTLVRADFHKNVGARVMRQSTMAWLDHGWAVSVTVIAGTEDDVEDLVDRLGLEAVSSKK